MTHFSHCLWSEKIGEGGGGELNTQGRQKLDLFIRIEGLQVTAPSTAQPDHLRVLRGA